MALANREPAVRGSAPSRALARPIVWGDGLTGFADAQQRPFMLPAGTVTFLLTDIEGSTRLWEREPDAMAAAVPEHYAVLAVAGKTLTLTPQGGKDACGQRGRTWAGRWTRVG